MIILHLESNPGHQGRPGLRGGSAPSSSDMISNLDNGPKDHFVYKDDRIEQLPRFDNNKLYDDYTSIESPKYGKINKDLRSGKITKEIRELDKLFTPAKHSFVVYRGVDTPREGVMRGYTSTSISALTALDFSKKNTIIRFRVPRGQKVLFGNPVEREIILPRGIRLRKIGTSTVNWENKSITVHDYQLN